MLMVASSTYNFGLQLYKRDLFKQAAIVLQFSCDASCKLTSLYSRGLELDAAQLQLSKRFELLSTCHSKAGDVLVGYSAPCR